MNQALKMCCRANLVFIQNLLTEVGSASTREGRREQSVIHLTLRGNGREKKNLGVNEHLARGYLYSQGPKGDKVSKWSPCPEQARIVGF